MRRQFDEELLLPLEEFAQLHRYTVRAAGVDLIDLSYPNPLFHRDVRARELLQEIAEKLEPRSLQYTPFGGATVVRRRIAASLKWTGLCFGYRDVVLTPGATAALCVALFALFQPGDEIILVTPCWMDYPIYLKRFGLVARMVASRPDKRLDLDAVSAACSTRTAGIIVSQPSCPTGVLMTAAELSGLAEVLTAATAYGRTAPVLISDEVHRDQTWADVTFSTPLSYYPAALSVYSFGKAWSMQGQRTGYIALSPNFPDGNEVRLQLERAMRVTGFCAPTALMQAVAGALAGMQPHREGLAFDQQVFRRGLDELGYRVTPGQGSCFIYAECPGGDDIEFVRKAAREGLLIMPSSIFYEPGYFRLALNVGADRVDDVMERLSCVVS
ncbi:aminotransferase class I/II-fold pyridoxal phosphate-dependent enzyme [Nocardia arthritidis]|uniref:Aminotransferase class I/II-fold pyridoxal phosphate-dependent enzyme n=1 Tax=Nocardia arthritidis TaxID=228602 RepID=A0A6G9Y9Z1_9NOCA|nr:aminotransferase class I/II-fold pyridoxal phosphate-dependent enzyme [Nocardia arthritidis]QIS09876.1 aminotransferase class I/II-fold pyridoxal phosphate-dependent enzyme [Nocardia arthritidis]